MRKAVYEKIQKKLAPKKNWPTANSWRGMLKSSESEKVQGLIVKNLDKARQKLSIFD